VTERWENEVYFIWLIIRNILEHSIDDDMLKYLPLKCMRMMIRMHRVLGKIPVAPDRQNATLRNSWRMASIATSQLCLNICEFLWNKQDFVFEFECLSILHESLGCNLK
jgi:hypothetical protein